MGASGNIASTDRLRYFRFAVAEIAVAVARRRTYPAGLDFSPTAVDSAESQRMAACFAGQRLARATPQPPAASNRQP